MHLLLSKLNIIFILEAFEKRIWHNTLVGHFYMFGKCFAARIFARSGLLAPCALI